MNYSFIFEIFDIKNAKSKGYESYLSGDVPFVSNGVENKGIIGFVKPISGDRVFNEVGICVSSFCEATVQTPPYIARGNGGSGLIVLTPKKEMSMEELYMYATQINFNKWRFSFGRMVTKRRIEKMKIYNYQIKKSINTEIGNLLPKKVTPIPTVNVTFSLIPLTEFCYIEKKAHTPINSLKIGNTPYITTTSKNNGVQAYVEGKPNFKAGSLTVALNGSCGETFYQYNDFITSSDNAVLRLKEKYSEKLLLIYIAYLIEKQKWRYNYYRKLRPHQLEKFKLPIPVTQDNKINLEFIRRTINSSYGFDIIKRNLD